MAPVLTLFGYDADGDICVLMLKQKKWNRDNPQYNFIEGFRNGPDLDQDPSKITQPLTDKDQAIQECLEETGIDLKERNVSVTPLNFTKDNGQEHYNISGAKNNFVLQNVNFFYAILPQNTSLPTPSPIDSTEKIEKGFWIKVKDIKDVNGHVRFTDPDTEQECGLGQSNVVSKALRDALKKTHD